MVMASVVNIFWIVLLLVFSVAGKSPFNLHYDNMKDDEYDMVIRSVLDLGFRTRHFDSFSCENWCRSAVPNYFSPKVDVTPKCLHHCEEFMIRQERAEGADL